MRRGFAICLGLAGMLFGCSREHYRKDADRESYTAIAERNGDPRWNVPRTAIDPPPESRLYDPYDPNYPPFPPDDPAAYQYMVRADGKRGWKHWLDHGMIDRVESPGWRDYLELNADGELELTPDRAVELAILHSREYQSALEELYLSALSLTLNRFEFAVKWFGRNATTFDHTGNSSLPNESNTLTTATDLGFSRAFTTGGQLLVDFANSFVWEYNGPNSNTVSSNFAATLIQPFLRHAGREVRMEELTQGERSLLYAVREFARFRKTFTANVTTRGGGFLNLLLQKQNLRNLEANLRSLDQNLRVHEAFLANGTVSTIQVDQVFQSYQQGRLSVLQARTGLENALDSYKTQLGLPPGIPVKLNDAILSPFQLDDPKVVELQDQVDKFLIAILQPDEAPPLADLQKNFGRLKDFQNRTQAEVERLSEELNRWQKQLSALVDEDMDKDPTKKEPNEGRARERTAFESLKRRHEEVVRDMKELERDREKSAAALAEPTRRQGWEQLQERIRTLQELVAKLFVIQTQVRVYLIQLKPLDYQLDAAVAYALEHRLDLMNERARVVDAWRQITVAADGLESELSVTAGMNLRTEADARNPFDLAASASSYRVGVQFDAPLNRELERNVYRASLISYQRARRRYMASADVIEQSIRRDLRQLETERLNFEIARQSLISAARQVERTRRELLVAPRNDSTTTTDILNALNSLLSAKNTLIGSWVNYETDRIQLLLDLEELQLDERGLTRDEPTTLRPADDSPPR